MGTEERIHPLHNFTMPGNLRWGNTRHLRCIKIDNYNHNHSFLNRSTLPQDDNEITAVRQKLITDLHTAADDIKHAVLKDDSMPNKPWNLRTRRAACKTKNSDEYFKLDYLPGDTAPVCLEKSMLVGKREREKFSVALSKKEMEEDFTVFGQRIHRRPKKRLRVVQKQLDTLFPGLWLREVTADMYKVVEAAP